MVITNPTQEAPIPARVRIISVAWDELCIICTVCRGACNTDKLFTLLTSIDSKPLRRSTRYLQ
ncbi:hypothetical protein BDB00DRAFT_798355 [Zychaea mexicana]|uniref:uncharacterized protein n=1 Tax=Zychaea mexicana TaxID=64656 RepID=UPI0022FF1E7D|nr:uncharacterized protein BDB00DRAFT_821411 [Zychaea mexicana]XP_052984025.1 uncharacterized protein BDB00DRAFT_803935 [Zychaea mexicana]XP_052985367.1 uncharacterized protein BDB00DRAFT_798355 [Zychaea mexicana]KAI9493971.1 hypothetical protein BDB00DRAFT_821411 [Zychaea mexicana]KAI9497760.1 hypothetical protein BDB00DRAFT_803935 [Zychaea mexicana]KAI9499102.1 hypothetical protein BDB00DRAFT_798355 [Zychaea mexicana]